jgi:dTDP-4-amino-4,6-dideoxygalactose transaminase
MRSTFLPFSPPCFGEEEIRAVSEVLRSGWITTGPRVKQFEAEFAARVGAPAALAVSSCTAALHTALVVAGVGPGDDVVTTPMTFCSTVNVIEQTGARPVLADIEPDTLNIDPARVAAAITPRTRAILPVHYGGHPADLDAIETLAREHGLVVIEDAAHALPASYRGRTIGSGRNPVAFSFYATKNVTTAEGGMLTADPEFIARARVMALHGMDHDAWRRYDKGGSWYYEVIAPGFKYNLTDIQAALGLCQLAKLDGFQRRRREVAAAYDAAFGKLPALETPTVRADVEPAWHLYPLRLHLDQLAIDRDRFIAGLAARNIGASVHFIPIHRHPYYRDKYGWRPEDLPVAESEYRRLVSLPLHPGLSEGEVGDVVEGALSILANAHR